MINSTRQRQVKQLSVEGRVQPDFGTTKALFSSLALGKQIMNKKELIVKNRLLRDRKKRLRINCTPEEMRFKSKLLKLKIKYQSQKGFIKNKNFCIVDFYINKYKLVIEIDGGYHGTSKQIIRDRNRDWYLTKQRGVNVIHLTNEFANNLTPIEIMDLIVKNQTLEVEICEAVYYD